MLLDLLPIENDVLVGAVDLVGNGTLSDTGTVVRVGSGSLTASGSLAAAGVNAVVAVTTLTGNGALSASGTVVPSSGAAAGPPKTSGETRISVGRAGLSGRGVMWTSGRTIRVHRTAAVLARTGCLYADATIIRHGTAELVGVTTCWATDFEAEDEELILLLARN